MCKDREKPRQCIRFFNPDSWNVLMYFTTVSAPHGAF